MARAQTRRPIVFREAMGSVGHDRAEHVAKRARFVGRWAPAAFYLLNVLLWFLTGVVFAAWDLLWLVVLTLPAIALYLRQTRWNRISRS